jgi:polygalacturonase
MILPLMREVPILFAFLSAAVLTAPHARAASPWERVPAILARIKAPTFPKRDFSILDYGAKPDGQTDASQAIRAAIAACHKAGGGRVVVPRGEFLTGAIRLLSNVNLHVSEGAVLKFDSAPARYLPAVLTRYEGVECMNYSPLIYAFGQENVAVTGKGTLDGQADYANWWGWVKKSAREKHPDPPQNPSRNQLMRWGEEGAPVAERVFEGESSRLRPTFIEPYRCRNVLIEGVTILRSPFWEIHPTLCENVTVREVNVRSLGPNNDGCDPESCIDVLIENCVFQTGDDCIAIKSGRNNDGRRLAVPSENIVVRKCRMLDGHGGVTIGSEISGDCRNVFAEDCQMDSPQLERALRIKSNALRGGVVENIHMRNVRIGQLADAVVTIDCVYENVVEGPHPPIVRNVSVENVTSQSSKYGLHLVGIAASPVRGVRLTDCAFSGVKKEDVVENVEGLVKTNVRIERR